MAVVQYQKGDQYYQINPATGAGHASGNPHEFDPAFEESAHAVTVDTITHPLVTEARPMTLIPVDPIVFTRTMQAAAGALRRSDGVRGGALASWLEEMAASVDDDPMAPDYEALAKEPEPTSQYEDTRQAAGYGSW